MILKNWKKSFKYDKNELSEVIAIDEQFPTVNGEKKAKSVIMDIGTNLILSDKIVPAKDLTPEFNEKTIKNTLKDIMLKEGKIGFVKNPTDKLFSTFYSNEDIE
jgi:hypothetical protein